MNNIDLALEKFKRALKPWHEVNYDCYSKVQEVLEEIKSDIDKNMFHSIIELINAGEDAEISNKFSLEYVKKFILLKQKVVKK